MMMMMSSRDSVVKLL